MELDVVENYDAVVLTPKQMRSEENAPAVTATCHGAQLMNLPSAESSEINCSSCLGKNPRRTIAIQ